MVGFHGRWPPEAGVTSKSKLIVSISVFIFVYVFVFVLFHRVELQSGC